MKKIVRLYDTNYEIGDKVRHKDYGEGTVASEDRLIVKVIFFNETNINIKSFKRETANKELKKITE